MKLQRTIYRVSLGLFSLWMISNAVAYLFSAEAKRLCVHFGFPAYLRVELGIAKFIGVAVLLLPVVNSRLKEWAYAGFAITIISGFIAHLASGDSLRSSLSPFVALALLFTSYFTYHKLQHIKTNA